MVRPDPEVLPTLRRYGLAMHIGQPLPDSAPCEADLAILSVLSQHDGTEVVVVTRSGDRFSVWNIAWGYDAGDEWSHVSTNVSPWIEDARFDFFTTDVVARIVDPASRAVLYSV